MTDNALPPTASCDPFAAKRLARLLAAQTLYQASYEQDDLATLLTRCVKEPTSLLNDEEAEGETIVGAPDATLLARIVHGAAEEREALENMVASALSEKLSFPRMEPLLKAILMAGSYELYRHGEIATGIIVSDYVDVARAFFGTKEPALVNAVLDRLAKTLRT